jgi:hypothetical protein
MKHQRKGASLVKKEGNFLGRDQQVKIPRGGRKCWYVLGEADGLGVHGRKTKTERKG